MSLTSADIQNGVTVPVITLPDSHLDLGLTYTSHNINKITMRQQVTHLISSSQALGDAGQQPHNARSLTVTYLITNVTEQSRRRPSSPGEVTPLRELENDDKISWTVHF